MKQKKTQYRVRNWGKYNAALVARGSLTLWVDEEALAAWQYTGPKQRGAQYVYAEAAIQCVLTLRAVYHVALRAAQGLAESVFALLQVSLPVPTYSTLSRRGARSEIELARLPSSGPVHLALDASGFKAYGEGEWKVRQHGWSMRRTWRKLHLAVDEATGEIMAAVASEAGVTDDDAVSDLVEQVDRPIAQLSADGAYDKRKVYEALEATGAKVTIPPRRDAKIWQHGNREGEPWQRDENLRAIRRLGRKRWKKECGYHRRSLAETAIFRLKTIFGATLGSRNFAQQATELFLRASALNRMTRLGMPESYPLAA
jgi:Transposase DDE domain